MSYQTREEWLQGAVAELRNSFDLIGKPLPKKIRVACGFPLNAKRSKAIGECWASDNSADKAIEILKSTPDIDTVICDYHMPDGTGARLYQYVLKNHPKTAFVLCSGDPPEVLPEFAGTKVAHIVKPDIVAGFRNVFKKKSTDRFIPMWIQSVHKYRITGADIYMRLAEDKHVKVFPAADVIPPEEFERLEQRGVHIVYLLEKDFARLVDTLSLEMYALSAAKKLEPGKPYVTSKEMTTAIQAIAHEIGLTEDTQELAKQSFEFALRMGRSEAKNIKELEVLNDKKSLLSDRSYTVATVACGIASLLGWSSELTFYKLCLAGALHNIPDDADKRNHPLVAAGLARKFKHFPEDTDVILEQHHEKADGSGYPKGLKAAQIIPLSAVFIVAQELVDYYLKTKSLALEDFLQAKESEYTEGAFQKIFLALSKNHPMMRSKAA